MPFLPVMCSLRRDKKVPKPAESVIHRLVGGGSIRGGFGHAGTIGFLWTSSTRFSKGRRCCRGMLEFRATATV